VVEARELVKKFGSVLAVDRATFEIAAGGDLRDPGPNARADDRDPDALRSHDADFRNGKGRGATSRREPRR